jgi:orotidine-5'-phosphate decarboxylase
MREHGPLCVGIDPHPGLLAAWGLADDPAGLERFALTCVEALAGQVAALKPQSAFFERHGALGIAVLERVLRQARSAGTLVILDAKRGDIGSTMAAYADAYLEPDGPLAADALTVNPYLGYESLRPAVDLALAHGAGLFVLGLTSNPQGPQVQHAVGPDGRSVAASVLAGVTADNLAGPAASDSAGPGSEQLGSIGLVIGATVGAAVRELGMDLVAGRAPLLAPGVGAQGGGPAELAEVFGAARGQVLASSSRQVLDAGPSTTALRDAALRTRDVVRAALADP